MLSDMVDRLRKVAQTERALGNHELELMLLDAADIIWELCNVGAENARLRDLLAEPTKCESCEAMLDCDECLRADSSQKERKRLEYENAKLRELVRDYDRCIMHADCDRCEYDGKLSTHCPLSPCFPDADELRDLGVEVDE